jgi:hypothetical protein
VKYPLRLRIYNPILRMMPGFLIHSAADQVIPEWFQSGADSRSVKQKGVAV